MNIPPNFERVLKVDPCRHFRQYTGSTAVSVAAHRGRWLRAVAQLATGWCGHFRGPSVEIRDTCEDWSPAIKWRVKETHFFIDGSTALGWDLTVLSISQSCTQSVELGPWLLSAHRRALTEQTHADVHASSGIRNHGLCVWACWECCEIIHA
jgi:hypothetical protein